MAFTFTLLELLDMVIMSLAVGFIFKDMFQRPVARETYDPIKAIHSKKKEDLLFAILVVAPAIILHEFGHKFVALAFGLSATFHAAYWWLGIGVLMKLFMPAFIFFVPAYVSIVGATTPGVHSLIAFAGPAVNGLLYLFSYVYLRYGKPKKEWKGALVISRRINGFLFIFNMIPIPGFDGAQVFSGLFSLL